MVLLSALRRCAQCVATRLVGRLTKLAEMRTARSHP